MVQEEISSEGGSNPVHSLHPSQPGSSRDPLLFLERLRSPSSLEYAEDEPMGEPEWSQDLLRFISSSSFNHLGKWLAKVDLGKPQSDEGKAWEGFKLDWSSQDEREEVEAQEDFNESKIEGLVRTHTHCPPHR